MNDGRGGPPEQDEAYFASLLQDMSGPFPPQRGGAPEPSVPSHDPGDSLPPGGRLFRTSRFGSGMMPQAGSGFRPAPAPGQGGGYPAGPGGFSGYGSSPASEPYPPGDWSPPPVPDSMNMVPPPYEPSGRSWGTGRNSRSTSSRGGSFRSAASRESSHPRSDQVLHNFSLEEDSLTAEEREILAIFRSGGLLSSRTAFFRERRPQTEMVKAVLAAVREHRNLVVEAGTGTGKTFAYLIPLLKLGLRVVVSTRTINLQDQLLKRDITHILEILGSDIRVAALKGRSNYLCHARLEDAEEAVGREVAGVAISFGDNRARDLKKIRDFLKQEPSGDLTLMNTRGMDRSLLDQVSGHSHLCRGRFCEHSEHCCFRLARNRAGEADLLVLNHNLLLQNYVMPRPLFNMTPDVIVIDEAHHLPGVVRDTFTNEQGNTPVRQIAAILELLSGILSGGRKKSDKDDGGRSAKSRECASASRKAEKLTRRLAEDLYRQLYSRFRSTGSERGGIAVLCHEALEKCPGVAEILKSYAGEMLSLNRGLGLRSLLGSLKGRIRGMVDTLSTTLEGLVNELAETAETFSTQTARTPGTVRIIELTETTVSLLTIPMDVSDSFSRQVLDAPAPAIVQDDDDDDYQDADEAEDDGGEDSGEDGDDESAPSGIRVAAAVPAAAVTHPVFVFTSATVTYRSSFESYCRRLGITGNLYLRVSSPFDYPRQGFLYFPDVIPGGKVLGKEHAEQVVAYAAPLLKILDGGFLFLCTSMGSMEMIHDLLKESPALGKRTLYCQGQNGKLEIVRGMLRNKNAVAVATSSFWEGVDIPGDALCCVIIDRMPFRPLDTLQKEINDYVEKVLKRNPFMENSLPEMIIALKQGVGRLIRSEKDFGVVAIADDRLGPGSRLRYRKPVLDELPPFAFSGSEEEIAEAWKRHRQENADAGQEADDDGLSEELDDGDDDDEDQETGS